MKATKLIAFMAIAAFGFCTQSAFAQSTDETEQTEPPVMTDESDGSEADPEPYNESVTIDSESEAAGTTSEGGYTEQVERKERLRVYSGKHDGNNVISDPR